MFAGLIMFPDFVVASITLFQYCVLQNDETSFEEYFDSRMTNQYNSLHLLCHIQKSVKYEKHNKNSCFIIDVVSSFMYNEQSIELLFRVK